eukprot:m.182295 g.182295  ORF g.182295 m.182295 type:complete len:83 (-) comp16883_c0_seq1:2841-3089(-)
MVCTPTKPQHEQVSHLIQFYSPHDQLTQESFNTMSFLGHTTLPTAKCFKASSPILTQSSYVTASSWPTLESLPTTPGNNTGS